MDFKQKYHFKDVLGVFTVEGWLMPHSLNLDLKITRDEEAVARTPRKCLTESDLTELLDKLCDIKAKIRELNP